MGVWVCVGGGRRGGGGTDRYHGNDRRGRLTLNEEETWVSQ